MTGQNDRQDRSLTGQVNDQAGHCPLTGRYLQPCHRSTPGLTVTNKKVVLDKSNKVLYTFKSYTKLLYRYCIFTFGRHSYCLQGTCKGACF